MRRPKRALRLSVTYWGKAPKPLKKTLRQCTFQKSRSCTSLRVICKITQSSIFYHTGSIITSFFSSLYIEKSSPVRHYPADKRGFQVKNNIFRKKYTKTNDTLPNISPYPLSDIVPESAHKPHLHNFPFHRPPIPAKQSHAAPS